MIIGLPKALDYYRNEVMWRTFFEELDCLTVVSRDSNKEILDLGIRYSVDESCLSAKLYFGHVAYLQDKCDKVLVPRLDSLGNNEFACTKFNALFDIAANIFDTEILDYNVDVRKGCREEAGFMEIGKRLGKKKSQARSAYFNAKKQQRQADEQKCIKQQKLLNSDNIKILIVSHDYNIYDNIIGRPIVQSFKKLGAEILLACEADKSVASELSRTLSPTLYWRYNKELIGSIELYKNKIDGIVFLTAFPCAPDSLVNELMLRRFAGTLPMLNIIVDEHQSETGLLTRAESFYDLLCAKKLQAEKKSI